MLQTADIIKPLVIGREVFAKQNRVGAEVDSAQRHRAVNPGEFPDALGSLHHVTAEVGRQHRAVGTFRTAELLPRSDFDWRLAGDVGNEEVEGDVLAVHVIVNPRLDVAWHCVRVQIVVIL